MQRRQWLFGALAASTGALTSCSQALPLRVGTHAWIGHEPLMLARDLHWLSPDVQLLSAPGARDSMAGLGEGRLDAATLTLDETLSSRASGVMLTVVLVLDTSSGADVVMARPGLDSLAALRGQRLAYERSAVGQLMLVKALEAAQLTADDLSLVAAAPHEQPAAVQQQRIDAAITFEPTASLLKRLGWHRLFDSRSMPDTIFDVLAVRSDRLKGRRAAIESAVQAHFLGLAHLRSNRPDATYRIASRNQIQPADVMQALAGVALPDLSRNKALLTEQGPMTVASRALNQLMVDHRLLPAPDTLQNLFDPRYLPDQEPTA